MEEIKRLLKLTLQKLEKISKKQKKIRDKSSLPDAATVSVMCSIY
jgi:hypothetical protein